MTIIDVIDKWNFPIINYSHTKLESISSHWIREANTFMHRVVTFSVLMLILTRIYSTQVRSFKADTGTKEKFIGETNYFPVQRTGELSAIYSF